MMAAALNLQPGKTLGDLLPELVAPLAQLPVAGIAIDSRAVTAGGVFLAYPGERVDGRQFIDQAIANGAVAVIAESGIERTDLAIPLIKIPQLRTRVSAMADRFFDHPSQAMRVIGITGTNGKTSCSQLLGQALRGSGKPCGVIGTLGNSLDGTVTGGGLTTPDPVALQQQLAQWRDRGVEHVAMEVSSHGLVQGRVNGIRFAGAVFTNLSRDHLDFHGSMDAYGAAKAKLFELPGLEFAVINRDDAFGAALADRLREILPVLDYGIRHDAAIAVRNAEFRADGVAATVATPWGQLSLRSHLLGEFNLSNLLAVIAVLGKLGFSADELQALVPTLRPIAGRMQRVGGVADIEVVVDYAHTPDALEQALSALRRHCSGKLWCVFGCGGDRDKGKRPLMGAIAARLADHVVLTSDNPRSENPQQILDDIRAGISGDVNVESDRAAAVAYAINHAQRGDAILLAGKGHEDYQIIGSETRPFSDVAVARAALFARGPA